MSLHLIYSTKSGIGDKKDKNEERTSRKQMIEKGDSVEKLVKKFPVGVEKKR